MDIFNDNFNEYVLKAMTYIKNNKQRPHNKTFLHFNKTIFATHVDSAIDCCNFNKLINKTLNKNRPNNESISYSNKEKLINNVEVENQNASKLKIS